MVDVKIKNQKQSSFQLFLILINSIIKSAQQSIILIFWVFKNTPTSPINPNKIYLTILFKYLQILKS